MIMHSGLCMAFCPSVIKCLKNNFYLRNCLTYGHQMWYITTAKGHMGQDKGHMGQGQDHPKCQNIGSLAHINFKLLYFRKGSSSTRLLVLRVNVPGNENLENSKK